MKFFGGIDMRAAKMVPTLTAMLLDPEGVTPADRAKVLLVALGMLGEVDTAEVADMVAATAALVPADQQWALRALLVDMLAALDRVRA